MKEEPWFTIEQIDEMTYCISEYRHWEETHCYLLNGTTYSLLIDTGLGIANIYEEIIKLTDKPVIAVATHIHWDHIGGHRYFSKFYAHESELPWLQGNFPLPLEMIQKQITECCDLPKDFDVHTYELFQGTPQRLLKDGDVIQLGERKIDVIHTPGHSPGHLCFWEKERGYLFTGDLVYKGTLLAYYPSTDPQAYLSSLAKLTTLPVQKIFSGHHSLAIQPNLIKRVYDALVALEHEGKLHHGSGKFDYGDWAIWL